MSTSLQMSPSTPNFHPIFEMALKEYKKKTRKEISTHPLAKEIRGCGSIEAILTVLQGKANELNQSQSNDERLTKWLTPTVNVLSALSVTLGEGVGTVFPPTKIIFSAMGILLVAAKGTAANRDELIELFGRIENFFVRLQTHVEVPPAAQMTNVMGKVMAEVLSMLAVATKAMYQSRKKTFLKKLVGRNDIEDALLRLDKLEQGELRTVTAQVLKTTSDLKDATSDIKDVTSDIKGDTKETKVMVQQIVGDVTSREWERLQGWLTPPDPSTNHANACSAQHERTAAWVFNEHIFKEWESSESGSLLWIHGKAGSGKSILCSAIIQHVITLRDAGSASVAYFYFDFRDLDKKDWRNLISSLLMQLSSRSKPCLDVLSRAYSTYNDGKERPSERTLVQCLKDMLMSLSLSQLPTYIILDALDECPNISGIPTPREQVLGLVEDLVDLRLPNLRICIMSRPEIDIRTTLKPLASGHFSLHDQPGQKKDIAEYVSAVVQSDTRMKRWREDDRKLVIDKLSEKADGMFRWVFCQLEVLRHCLAPSLRRQLNELPKSLDETYERVLKEIESTNQGRHARRLLQCLVVAMRPLRVEELAEVLTFDLDGARAEIPMFHAEWRWEDQEQAVLSACSSLVVIVGGDDSRVVQFSHFSVKEFLTSDRLATTSGDVSRYHIAPEPAHFLVAQACLGALLNSDNRVIKENEESSDEGTIPLLKYAAEHWASHVQVGNVSSRVKYAMETLFDLDKPYFLEWKRIYDIYPYTLCNPNFRIKPSNPLYYAALCGFYDLAQCLISKYPDQVNHDGSHYNSPLAAALFRKHVRVADLLLEYGAHAHVRGNPPLFHAIEFSDDARVTAVQFLLRNGAHVNAGDNLWTPLHLAADVGDPEVAQILLEHGADIDIRDNHGQVPLHLVSTSEREIRRDEGGERFILARLLVERCADVNARDEEGTTPLHFASGYWRFEIARLLLEHGANADARNVHGRNPLHELSRRYSYSSYIDDHSRERPSGVKLQNVISVTKLLLEHGVDMNAQDKDQATPLHFASSYGMLKVVRLLLDHGAKADMVNVLGQTPLHLVSQSESFSHEDPDIARLLLELGIDVNTKDKDQATPLHLACSHGNFETALVLLDNGAEVNAQNVVGQTPLHRVSPSTDSGSNDNPRVAQLMLERGSDANARDKDQSTPLHLACYMSMFKTAQVLLDHGAEADAKNADGQTPLHRVSQNLISHGLAQSNLVRLLLERGADANARDNDQETPLHVACSHGYAEIVQVLLDHGAEVSAQNANGQTPLHRVLQSLPYWINARVAQLLLERGVDVNARDKHQSTPLHLASYGSRSEIVQVLLDHGADAGARNADDQTPLHRVSQSSRSSHDEYDISHVTRLLLDCGVDVNARDKEQAAPLHLASYYGHVEAAEVLLDHDAWVNAKDIRGQTPLHQLLLGSHNRGDPGKVVRLTQRLLERGADVNAQNMDHETPLHLASRLRLHEVARILLKHGADVNVKNSEGKSLLQLASGRKGKAMKRLLLKYSAK